MSDPVMKTLIRPEKDTFLAEENPFESMMERFDLAPDRAFDVLSRLSQHRNLKLRQLAEQIVHTRVVPKE